MRESDCEKENLRELEIEKGRVIESFEIERLIEGE